MPHLRSTVIGLVIAGGYRIGSLSPVLLGFLKGNIGLSSALALLAFANVLGGLAILAATQVFHARDAAAAGLAGAG